jgi:membrane fusion protein (multidrug efflux system)
MVAFRSPLVFCLVACTALFTGCGPKSPAGNAGSAALDTQLQKQPVEVTPLVRRDLIEILPVIGSLAANESAEIRPEIAGQVKEVFFDEGQRVTKNQLLVKIDDSELRAQYSATEARFKLAELNLKRNESLAESKMVSQADFDRARAEYAAATAELSLLRVRLEKTQVKAPFDGLAGSRSVSPGDYVSAQSVITVVNDLSRLKIAFQVPERYLSKLKHGTKFSVTAKTLAAAREIEGEVYFVGSVIDRSTRSSEVKGLLTNPPEQLKPGMFANVDLVLEIRRQVLTAPEGAILNTPSGPQLILVKGAGQESVAEFVPITLGLRSRGVVEVQSVKGELSDEQPVVAAGVGALVLFPGAKLEPRPLRAEFRVGGES